MAAKPVAVSSLKEGQISSGFWSKDGRSLYFQQDASLWQADPSGGSARPVWGNTVRASNVVLSPSGTQWAFVRTDGKTGSDLFLRSVSTSAEKKIAHDNISIMGLAWSPDEMHVSFIAGSRSIRHEEAPSYSGAKIIYTTTEHVPGKLSIASTGGGDVVTIQS